MTKWIELMDHKINFKSVIHITCSEVTNLKYFKESNDRTNINEIKN